MNRVPMVATILGRAGLVPFIAAPILLLALPRQGALTCAILADYAFGIIAFLQGIWWGLGLIRRNAPALLASNALFLAAFAGHTLLPDSLFLVLAAMLLCITLAAERTQALFRPQPAYYAALRLQLTAVATIGLLVSAALSA